MTRLPSPPAPLISVVVTCFNYARYVNDAIECVLSQDYPNKELVVVNDGSTDDSLRVILRHAARTRIIDQPNLGQIAASNRGFAATRGDVVIFLDADDRLEPGALSEVARVWTSACAKVQYDLKIIDTAGRDSGRRFCHFAGDYDARRVREAFRRTGTYRWPVTAGNAYSRWFVERLMPLGTERRDGFVDGLLNTVAPVYGEVRTIPRALGCYRLHGENGWSSSGADPRRLPERIRRRLQEIAFLRLHAAKNNVSLPAGNLLDHELAFINYRLMAFKLGLDYPGSGEDSQATLVALAYRVLLREKYPPLLALSHLLWFALLFISPRAIARRLIGVRLGRSVIRQAMTLRWEQFRGRFLHAA